MKTEPGLLFPQHKTTLHRGGRGVLAGKQGLVASKNKLALAVQGRSLKKVQGKVVVKQERKDGADAGAAGKPLWRPAGKTIGSNRGDPRKTIGKHTVSKSKLLSKNLGQDNRKHNAPPPPRGRYGKKKAPNVKVEKPSVDPIKTSPTAVEDKSDDVAIEYEEVEESSCPYCMKQFKHWNAVSSHMLKAHKDQV